MAKSGDLRVLKNGAVYGPFDRALLEQMIESGRIDQNDQVSVRGAPWRSIAEFLLAPPAPIADPSSPAEPIPDSPLPDSPMPGSAPKKQGSLRVLRGNRMVGSLDRSQVEQLYAVGRVGDDDLICAKGGPWMLVGDFLAPPPPRLATGATPAAQASGPSEPATSQPSVVPVQARQDSRAQPRPAQPPVAQPPVAQRPATQRPVVQPVYRQPPVVRPIYAQQPAADPPLAQPPVAHPVAGRPPLEQPAYEAPPDEAPAYEEPEWVTPEDAAVETAIRRDLFAELDEPVLKDEWYVRVRGIHSAPLKKQHVRMLIESREITLDDAARHCSWRETDWRAIRTIPQLAGFLASEEHA